jgi:hypothetical protein
MSQFRIKNIDQSIPDEWVYKINEGINSVGDDIDARDPNELADAIFDTQNIILKVNTLPPGAILKQNSGLAERITILEGIAGNSNLQDMYNNGNTISMVVGKPLTFGIREEFKLDDNGNLSFKPVTMKVRGMGFQTLNFTNLSVTTELGDLLVGATSPGSRLTLKAEDYFYLKDVFLTNGVTLSEPGQSNLSTTSQSLVGAINELKASSFNTSFQAVYAQSTPPRLTTNISQGAVIIEDPNPLSNADALRVVGILNATRRVRTADLRVGNNSTLSDGAGFVTSDLIRTTNRVETPAINSGTNELSLTDKRVSFNFSDNTVVDLLTTRKSVIGAINELKTDITTVGNSASLLNIQHDSATGFHKIITTQAEVGANATKRITIRNQSGTETFSVNGFGELVAGTAVIGGLSVVSLLNQLSAHLSDDGTSHTAFANHLIDPNPHNTVKTILGLAGAVALSSSNGTIEITTSGNTIDLKFNNTTTMQQVYNNQSVAKELNLTSVNGLSFVDNTAQLIIKFQQSNILINKNLLFQNSLANIGSNGTLKIQPQTSLTLTSTTENVEIATVDVSKKVIIQNVDFNEAGASSIPSNLGSSVLGAFKKISDGMEIVLLNDGKYPINFNWPMFADPLGRAFAHIPDLHPANEHLTSAVDFYWNNYDTLYYPKETIEEGLTGTFYTSGTHQVAGAISAPLPLRFYKGAKLYPARLSYYDVVMTSVSSMADNNGIIIDSELELRGRTVATPDFDIGQFRIEQGATAVEIRTDKTRDNMIASINKNEFLSNALIPFTLKAGIWGEAPKGTILINGTVNNNDTITINGAPTLEGISVTLTAKTTPTGWLEFQASANTQVVAQSLAEAINRTMFMNSATGTNGHKCKAIANGSMVRVEYFKPGLTGQLISISASTANMVGGLLSGGTCVLRIYNMNLTNNDQLTVTTVGTGLGITAPAPAFTAREKTNEYFLTSSEALSSSRYAPHYRARELGVIEAASGNTITFKIKV